MSNSALEICVVKKVLNLKIEESVFNPYTLLSDHHKDVVSNLNDKSKIGAEAVFIGYMRDFREDKEVSSMEIFHYPKMTEYQITKIAEGIIAKFSLHDLFVTHRIGKIDVNDVIVVISAKASHRANAIKATEEMLEQLKNNVPFWKKEITPNRFGLGRQKHGK